MNTGQVNQKVEAFDLESILTGNSVTAAMAPAGSWFPEGDWSSRKLALTTAVRALEELCSTVCPKTVTSTEIRQKMISTLKA